MISPHPIASIVGILIVALSLSRACSSGWSAGCSRSGRTATAPIAWDRSGFCKCSPT